jgi:galactokinase
MTMEAWISQRLAAFERHYDRAPEALGCAPGRVNLIGEHTDYSEGLVLPCAIDRYTVAVAARRKDRRVRVRADDLGEAAEFDADAPVRRGGWIDYVQAVVASLAERGTAVEGLDLTIASRIPMGSGLSSSAALGLAVIGAIDSLQSLALTAIERARIVHRGECEFVGVGCGILDQFASALGRRGHALRIDCRSQSVDAVPLGGARLALLLVHSGVERALAEGAYKDRVAECRAAITAARAAGIAGADAMSLRDLGPAALPALERALDPLLLRRARHVITENARVDAFCLAMARGDHEALGRLLAEGQASLRDDYAVSTPELDALCEIGNATDGVVGSRLTGAGFGGCTFHLVAPGDVERARAAIESAFATRFARRPETLVVQPSDGAFGRRLR